MRIELNTTPSKVASAILSLKGRQLSFHDYMPFETVYDIDPDFLVMKAGRQVGKSVSQGGRLCIKSILRSHFNSLYIAPLQIQSKRFSSMYVDPFMMSPLIKKHFTNRGTLQNVYEKGFNNGSKIFLSYAENESDADRIRGIMADQLLIDEAQDVSYDALAPIFEILSASDYQFKVLSGTSKSTANTLELAWQSTNQMEWVVKCPHCNHYIIPDNEATCLRVCSQDFGPACDKCLKPIDVRTGKWMAALPGRNTRIGFHLPQFVMGANTSPKKWRGLRTKITQSQTGGLYSPAKLSNEVFGLATDLAGKTLSIKECIACSNPQWTSWVPQPPSHRTMPTVVLGLDWSTTGSTKSYTVATVIGYDHSGKMHILYSEKMQGINILEQVEKVIDIYHRFGCTLIGSDRGVGVVQVQILQTRLGIERVFPVNYVSSKKKISWDTTGFFIAADRTRVIDDVIMKIRGGPSQFETPCYDLMETYWKDGLALFEEETMAGNRVYRHHPDEPDDWIHSIVFGNVAYQYSTGNYNIYE